MSLRVRKANLSARLTWICPECRAEYDYSGGSTATCPIGCGEFQFNCDTLRDKLELILSVLPKKKANPRDRMSPEMRKLCPKK